jgi:hypothetical protein
MVMEELDLPARRVKYPRKPLNSGELSPEVRKAFGIRQELQDPLPGEAPQPPREPAWVIDESAEADMTAEPVEPQPMPDPIYEPTDIEAPEPMEGAGEVVVPEPEQPDLEAPSEPMDEGEPIPEPDATTEDATEAEDEPADAPIDVIDVTTPADEEQAPAIEEAPAEEEKAPVEEAEPTDEESDEEVDAAAVEAPAMSPIIDVTDLKPVEDTPQDSADNDAPEASTGSEAGAIMPQLQESSETDIATQPPKAVTDPVVLQTKVLPKAEPVDPVVKAPAQPVSALQRRVALEPTPVSRGTMLATFEPAETEATKDADAKQSKPVPSSSPKAESGRATSEKIDLDAVKRDLGLD